MMLFFNSISVLTVILHSITIFAFDLGNGLYESRTNITVAANLALDVRDIVNYQNATNGGIEKSRDIYLNGNHSDISLHELSSKAKIDMDGEPWFMLYRYGTEDLLRLEPDYSADGYNDTVIPGEGDYADKIVMKYLENDSIDWSSLADEGIVFLNVWMYVLHMLESSVRSCQSTDFNKAKEYVDYAAAYYIGADQNASNIELSHLNGHMLYSKFQALGNEFGTIRNNKMANVNHRILFQILPGMIHSIETSKCEHHDDYKNLRHFINQAVQQMTIPLMQGLMKGLTLGNAPLASLFATSLIPQLEVCGNAAHIKYLREHLVDLNDEMNAMEVDALQISSIVQILQHSYPCLGLTCSEVGSKFDVGDGSDCEEIFDESLGIDGYEIWSNDDKEDVLEHSLVDLDINLVNILLKMNAIEAAKDVYLFGVHTHETKYSSPGHNRYTSLQIISTDSDRFAIPLYTVFKDYYGDLDYSHNQVLNLLEPNKNEQFEGLSRYQRAAAVSILLKSIVFMRVLQGIRTAANVCTSINDYDLKMPNIWDKSVAYYVGWAESSLRGLLNHQCDFFNSCISLNKAETDSDVLYLFRKG